uniref:Uncharacterized protein n=1 Tax=Rhizophora mucronata TaxID=61149 RepID=A0A2P2Q0U3_RHIMU
MIPDEHCQETNVFFGLNINRSNNSHLYRFP